MGSDVADDNIYNYYHDSHMYCSRYSEHVKWKDNLCPKNLLILMKTYSVYSLMRSNTLLFCQRLFTDTGVFTAKTKQHTETVKNWL